MRAMGVVGLVQSQLQRYPVEALETLCHAVRGDELDARRAPHAPRPKLLGRTVRLYVYIAPSPYFTCGAMCVDLLSGCRRRGPIETGA